MPSKPRGRSKASESDLPAPAKTTKTRKARSNSSSANGSSVQHRRVEPGSTYLITKKTNDDLFWLVPSPLVNAILLFLLILKATKHGMLIHGFVFMSTHFHLLVTDTKGRLPAFMGEFLSESGKALKVARKTTRRVWSGRRYSATHILDLDAAERKLAYEILNPLEAGLTEPEEWPGLTSARFRFGDTISATRPEVYFSKKRAELVSLVLAPLAPAFAPETESGNQSVPRPTPAPADADRDASGSTAGTAAATEDPSELRIRDLVESGRAAIHRRLEKEGLELAGVARVLATRWTRRSTHPIGDLNPRFATRNAERLEAAIEQMKQFEIDHDAAKRAYVAGHHRTLFPSGTYGYRVVLGVRVAKRGRPAA